MGNLHNDRYDEIKSLLKKSKMLFEQETQDNMAASIENRIEQDTDYETAVDNKEQGETQTPKDKSQKYRISGGILALHGKDRNDLDITSDEKVAFQETMDEFVEFTFTIGENSGIYINGEMMKVDEDFLDMINKLQQFYQKFKSKWGKVLANRKKTKESPE
jgi:hypothetical protein